MIDQINILDCVDVINNSVLPYEGIRGYLDTGGLKSNKIVEIRDFDFDDKPSRANQNVEIGDIILARMKATTKVKVISQSESELMVSTGFIVLRPKRKIIDINFLKHTLISQFFQRKKDKLCSGSTQKAINNGNFKKLKIPLPPLDQQKKIAAILDTADAYRQITKALIEKYDQLTQSLFLDMFGDTKINPKAWPIMNLVDICDEVIDCPHSTPKYVEQITEYPCIRTTELDNGNINWSKMKYLNHEGYLERTKRLIPKPGDIVYGREGTFGEAAIVPKGYKMSLGQRVMLFRPKKDIMNSIFFHAVIRSKGLYHQALRVNSGSTVGHVNVKDIKKFKLIKAPLSLQNQFADSVQAIKAQKAQAQASLAKAEDLFNSLLQRAFKGELTS